jgi:hypothetical protein
MEGSPKTGIAIQYELYMAGSRMIYCLTFGFWKYGKVWYTE